MATPSKNIFWRDITDSDTVTDCGNHWEARGAVVYWEGQHAVIAQRWLANRAKRDARKATAKKFAAKKR